MKILLIQTAFIGDVILATPLVEKLHRFYPNAQVDVMLRKGNEGLLAGNPHVGKLWIWNKREKKYRHLFALLRKVRRERYGVVVNLQRFAATGLFSVLAGAKSVVGFDKNPLSRFYGKSVAHEVGGGLHEVQRNLRLIAHLTDEAFEMPKLYPQPADFESVERLKGKPYVTISPTSVWFTKQFPLEKWAELIALTGDGKAIYLLGGGGDASPCEQLARQSGGRAVSLAGQLSFLQSAALMRDAAMNYVNDSAPLHLASAMNAPTTAVFCSTVPAFGFAPLAQVARVVEATPPPACRPCGLHGYKACPKGHFRCAYSIQPEQLLELGMTLLQ
ncbi:MAG: glycosyltransferase family 9 protein [Prevotellaceae bacterium]|jgi:heptosyltransferase-2|nr:glycosyltransferase family 9 protein [Prevotellaceae bacterium]